MTDEQGRPMEALPDEVELAARFAELGHTSSRVVWDDPAVDWAAHDAVVLRSTWDYFDRRDQFVAWAARVGEQTVLCNGADVVRWNSHKGYLLELEDRGAPVVPTAWLGRGDEVDLAELAASRGWTDVVAKPCIGGGALGLLRADGDLREAQPAFEALLAEHDVMVQSFLSRLPEEGELSLVLVEGRVTHAVRKRPVPGEIRVQVQFGGRYEAEEPDPETVRLAEWVVEVCEADLLYARVDLVPDEDGTLLLGELELIEPDLYLPLAPDRGARLAEALVARAGGTST